MNANSTFDALTAGHIALPRNPKDAADLERALSSGALTLPGRAEVLRPEASSLAIALPSAGASLQPDLNQARRFLEILDPQRVFTFQTFSDQAHLKQGGKDPLAEWLHGTLDEHSETLVTRNQQGAGVFVMINEGDGKGRSSGNVIRVRAHFLDLDGAPLEPVLAAGATPHLVVESSPGKWHVYWLVSDGNPDAFKAQQRALAATFGGDIMVSDLPRVMRLPGFYHRKTDAPFMTRLVESAAG